MLTSAVWEPPGGLLQTLGFACLWSDSKMRQRKRPVSRSLFSLLIAFWVLSQLPRVERDSGLHCGGGGGGGEGENWSTSGKRRDEETRREEGERKERRGLLTHDLWTFEALGSAKLLLAAAMAAVAINLLFLLMAFLLDWLSLLGCSMLQCKGFLLRT